MLSCGVFCKWADQIQQFSDIDMVNLVIAKIGIANM